MIVVIRALADHLEGDQQHRHRAWPADLPGRPRRRLDQRIGQLIATLTRLASEAALTVQAELQHRADEAGALRAAHVERARYHAHLARRRYLPVDPADRLVADILEAELEHRGRGHGTGALYRTQSASERTT